MSTKVKSAVSNESEQIFLLPKSALKADLAEIHLLKHPKNEQPFMVLLSTNKSYEVRECKDNFRSWFLGQKVIQHGRLFVITPMDPVLLMLPYIMKAGERNTFSSVDQILHDEEFPSTDCLTKMDARLNSICDCKLVDESTFVRYNETKTLSWLEKKIRRTAKTLRQINFHVGPGFSVETCVMSKSETFPEECYLKYALELVGDYVTNNLIENLKMKMGIKDLDECDNEVSPSAAAPLKKRKVEPPSEDYSKILAPMKQKQNLTAAQKKLAKIDKTGMKALTNFFTVKPKK